MSTLAEITYQDIQSQKYVGNAQETFSLPQAPVLSGIIPTLFLADATLYLFNGTDVSVTIEFYGAPAVDMTDQVLLGSIVIAAGASDFNRISNTHNAVRARVVPASPAGSGNVRIRLAARRM